MNGNEVSCISDFYDIENLAAIEDTRFYNEPTFYKVEVGGNQSVYVSTGNIRQSQFAEIVNQSSGDISIVSGMHGGPDGSLLSEYNGVSGKQLLNEDLKVWGDSLNIKIYNVSKLSSEELKSVIKSSDITICVGVLAKEANYIRSTWLLITRNDRYFSLGECYLC